MEARGFVVVIVAVVLLLLLQGIGCLDMHLHAVPDRATLSVNQETDV